MLRIRLIVAGVAVAAAAATVTIVALTRDDLGEAAGPPPPLALELDPGAEQRALGRAVALYRAGRYDDARTIFDRYSSPEARVGSAFTRWPGETLELLRRRANDSAARLHLGIALAAMGDEDEARRVLRSVEPLNPDSPYAIRAEDLLHPQYVPGVPFFVPERRPPPQSLLAKGLAALRAGHRLGARQLLAHAVKMDPDDPQLLTAAAVAEFDKDSPARAFSRLGPLTRRFPRAQTVRFHLGLLLVWIGDVEDARRQFELSRALGPKTPLGRDAARFLAQLGPGTS